MKRIITLHLLILCGLLGNAYAQQGMTYNPLVGNFDMCLRVEEEDGSPSNGICGKLKVPNASLTDNGDGTFSFASGLASGGTLTTGYHCRYDGTGIDCDRVEDASGSCGANAVCMGGHTHPTTEISGVNAGTDLTADLEEEAHAAEHAVGGADTVFPADPGADKYLMWDDSPVGELVWADSGAGGGATTALDNLAAVAINESLLSDTADTDDLGSTAKEWANLYIGDAGKIYLGLGQDASINRSGANAMTITATSGVTISDALIIDEGALADSTVVSADIKDATIVTGDIAADTITHANIADADQAMTICGHYYESDGIDDADDIVSWWANKTANDFTLTELWCQTDTGTVTAMVQVDDGTPADIDGTDIVCDSDEQEDTSLNGDTEIAAGEEVDWAVTSTASTPTWVHWCITGNWKD